MLYDCHPLHKKYSTPLKRTIPKIKYQSEDEQDYTIDSPTLTKTYSVPSTIDSPHIHSAELQIFNDYDYNLEF